MRRAILAGARMRRAILCAATLALALGAAPAQAKGPFTAVVSGGDLSSPVRIGNAEIDRVIQTTQAWLWDQGPAPAVPPGRPAYRISLYQAADGQPLRGAAPFATLRYFPAFPARAGATPRLESLGGEGARWLVPAPAFAALLDRRIRAGGGLPQAPPTRAPAGEPAGAPRPGWLAALALGMLVGGWTLFALRGQIRAARRAQPNVCS